MDIEELIAYLQEEKEAPYTLPFTDTELNLLMAALSEWKPLTVRSQNTIRIMDAIYRFTATHGGRSPSVREVQEMAGISTTSVVAHHLRVLERMGYITLAGGTRQIGVVGSSYTNPPLPGWAIGENSE